MDAVDHVPVVDDWLKNLVLDIHPQGLGEVLDDVDLPHSSEVLPDDFVVLNDSVS